MRRLLVSLNSHSAPGAEPRKRPRQQRSQETVDRILDAAARIFDARGYAATTNHVADAAGVSVGSLYQYFPNKDALLVGLAERHVDEALEMLGLVARELRDAPGPLDAVCRTFVRAAVELNDADRLHRLLWEAPRTSALNARLDRLTTWLVDELAWHLERSGLDAEAARRRAAVVVPAVDAAVHTVDLDGDVLVDELTRLVVAYAGVEG